MPLLCFYEALLQGASLSASLSMQAACLQPSVIRSILFFLFKNKKHERLSNCRRNHHTDMFFFLHICRKCPNIKAGCFRLMPLTFGFPLFSEAIQVAYSNQWRSSEGSGTHLACYGKLARTSPQRAVCGNGWTCETHFGESMLKVQSPECRPYPGLASNLRWRL